MKRRTRGRELALQFLYMLDLRGVDLLPEARGFVRGEERDQETSTFALRLIEGTQQHRPEIDAMIQGVAQNWQIPRMAVIDRNVLRIATFELMHCPDVPPIAAINEAIELGKRYSTQNSGAFINGILDKIMSRTRGPVRGSAPAPDAPEAAVTPPPQPDGDAASGANAGPAASGTGSAAEGAGGAAGGALDGPAGRAADSAVGAQVGVDATGRVVALPGSGAAGAGGAGS